MSVREKFGVNSSDNRVKRTDQKREKSSTVSSQQFVTDKPEEEVR